MEISYKKDGNKTFMIIKDIEIDENDYKYQMVNNNAIEGLISMSVKSMDNRQEIYYDTTSLLSMESTYAKKQISGEEIYHLIKSIKSLSEHLREYLININGVLFGMEYIYKKRLEEKYMFCYCPVGERNFHEDMRNFFGLLPEYIDHNDEQAVLIAYGLQQVIDSDDFTVQDLVDCAEKNVKERDPDYFKITENYSMAEDNTITVTEEKEVKKRENKGKKKKGIIKSIFGQFKKNKDYMNEEELRLYRKDDIYGFDENQLYIYGESRMEKEGKKCDETILSSVGGMGERLTLKGYSRDCKSEITPDRFPCIIGKSKRSCDFTVNSPVVSRTHIQIFQNMQSYFVEDLNSSNGTFVNDVRLAPYELKEIKHGDRITLANVEFAVEQVKYK